MMMPGVGCVTRLAFFVTRLGHMGRMLQLVPQPVLARVRRLAKMQSAPQQGGYQQEFQG